jgi:hypothetical protein
MEEREKERYFDRAWREETQNASSKYATLYMRMTSYVQRDGLSS